MSSFCVSSKWAFFFFFFCNIPGRKKRLCQPTLPISRLTFPHRLLSSCEMVKHHRSVGLPVDEQAAEHTPILHKGLPSRSLLLLFHGLEWDINLTKLQQTANLWEKRPRHELWCCVFRSPFSSTPSAQIKKTSDAWNSLRSSWCCRLLDAVTRHQHCFPSHFVPEK